MPEAAVVLTGVEELADRLDYAAAHITTKALLSEVGNFIRLRTLERTAQGVDYLDNDFEPYSPEYAFFRERAGLPTSVVDLFFTGSMLSSLTFEADRYQVRLFFMPTQDKFGMDNPAKAYFLNENREFFALNPDDIDAIIDVSRQHVMAALRGNVKRRKTL